MNNRTVYLENLDVLGKSYQRIAANTDYSDILDLISGKMLIQLNHIEKYEASNLEVLDDLSLLHQRITSCRRYTPCTEVLRKIEELITDVVSSF